MDWWLDSALISLSVVSVLSTSCSPVVVPLEGVEDGKWNRFDIYLEQSKLREEEKSAGKGRLKSEDRKGRMALVRHEFLVGWFHFSQSAWVLLSGLRLLLSLASGRGSRMSSADKYDVLVYFYATAYTNSVNLHAWKSPTGNGSTEVVLKCHLAVNYKPRISPRLRTIKYNYSNESSQCPTPHHLIIYTSSHLAGRRITTEASRRRSASGKGRLQALGRRVDAQRSRGQRTEEVEEVEAVQCPLDLEASHPALEAAVDVVVLLGKGIEDLLRHHGVLLDLEAERQQRGEGVRELQDADGAHEAGDGGELGDGRAHDERDAPVDGHEAHPEQLAARGGERGRVHERLQHLDVHDLDADVAVQRRGDEPRDHVHDVRGRLPGVGRQALHHGVVRVLALVGVDEEAEEHVAHVDEDVGAQQALPEVPRVTHLGHEGDEEHRSAVRVHCLVEAVQRAGEAVPAGRFAVRWCTSVAVNRAFCECGAV